MTEVEPVSLDEVPEDPPKYPTINGSWSRVCCYCGEGRVKLEGYANWYNAVYRCPECGESMVYNPNMKERHWRHQVEGLTCEPCSYENEVKYPDMAGQTHEEGDSQLDE